MGVFVATKLGEDCVEALLTRTKEATAMTAAAGTGRETGEEEKEEDGRIAWWRTRFQFVGGTSRKSKQT